MTYARHSNQLSSAGFLAWHTHSDTEHMFIIAISEDMWHWYLLTSVAQWSCHYLFFRLGSVAAGIRGKRGARSNRLRDKLLMLQNAKCITEIMHKWAKLLGIHHTNFSDSILANLKNRMQTKQYAMTYNGSILKWKQYLQGTNFWWKDLWPKMFQTFNFH